MNKIIIVVALLTFLGKWNAEAQTEHSESLTDTLELHSFAYLSVTSPFEKYNSVDFGYMKVLNTRNAVGVGLGYIYDIEGFNTTIDESRYQNVNGVKFYAYYRFLFDNESAYPFNSTTFIDLEPQIFWVAFDSERVAGYSCNDMFGGCEYYRLLDSRVQRVVPGFNFKLGKIYNYDPFYFTLFVGGGMGHVFDFSDTSPDLPTPQKLYIKGESDSEVEAGTMLRFRLGFQLGYKL